MCEGGRILAAIVFWHTPTPKHVCLHPSIRSSPYPGNRLSWKCKPTDAPLSCLFLVLQMGSPMDQRDRDRRRDGAGAETNGSSKDLRGTRGAGMGRTCVLKIVAPCGDPSVAFSFFFRFQNVSYIHIYLQYIYIYLFCYNLYLG